MRKCFACVDTTFTRTFGKLQLVKRTLVCVTKPGNTHNQYTMAIEKNRTIKGHLCYKILCACILILKKDSHIHCRVTRWWRYSADLGQGGVRIVLQHSGIIFWGSFCAQCFNFHGFNIHSWAYATMKIKLAQKFCTYMYTERSGC